MIVNLPKKEDAHLNLDQENQYHDTEFIEVNTMCSTPVNSTRAQNQKHTLEDPKSPLLLDQIISNEDNQARQVAILKRRFLKNHESNLPLYIKIKLMGSLQEKAKDTLKIQYKDSSILKKHILGFADEYPDGRKPLVMSETLKMIAFRHLSSLFPSNQEKRLTKTNGLYSSHAHSSYLSSFVSQSTTCEPPEDLKDLEEYKKQEVKKINAFVKEQKELLRTYKHNIHYAREDLEQLSSLLQAKANLLNDQEMQIRTLQDKITALSQKGYSVIKSSKARKLPVNPEDRHVETVPDSTTPKKLNSKSVVFYSPRNLSKPNHFSKIDSDASRLNNTIIGDISASIKNFFKRRSNKKEKNNNQKQDGNNNNNNDNILPADILHTEGN